MGDYCVKVGIGTGTPASPASEKWVIAWGEKTLLIFQARVFYWPSFESH